jgi:hypothetical protein
LVDRGIDEETNIPEGGTSLMLLLLMMMMTTTTTIEIMKLYIPLTVATFLT